MRLTAGYLHPRPNRPGTVFKTPVPAAVLPSGPVTAGRPPLSVRTPVPLDALRDAGERAYLGPNGAPRLVPLAPFNAQGAPQVFIHGFTGDPANQEAMIREAQARGRQVWVMAYDSTGRGASANAAEFAEELRLMAAEARRELEVVAHSLGALTLKGAFDYLSAEGDFPFRRIGLVAIAAPWGGVDVAELARHLRPQDRRLAFAHDLAPGGAFMRRLAAAPFPDAVTWVDVAGARDPLSFLPTSKRALRQAAVIQASAARRLQIPGASHNTILWAPGTIAVAFDPLGSRDPGTQRKPSLWTTLVQEARAVFGLPGAFRGDPRY